jgi:hypothetical protein
MDSLGKELLEELDDPGFCQCLLAILRNPSSQGLGMLYEEWILARLRLIRQRAAPIYYGHFLSPLRQAFPGQVYPPDIAAAMAGVTLQPQADSGDMLPEEWSGSIEEMFLHGLPKTHTPGWQTLARHYTVRRGEMTVVTGIASHMKSTFMHSLALNLAHLHGWNISLFNPEHQPLGALGSWLVEAYARQPQHAMTADDRAQAISWVTDHFHCIAASEETQPTLGWILAVARLQKERYGLDGLIIDPWNEVEHCYGPDDKETQYISSCLSQIRRFARVQGMHVWIVAHPTKLQKAVSGTYAGQYPPPRPYDISGCYAADTEVLTTAGWKTHQQITLEDEVACFDLKTHTLSYQCPIQQWEYDYAGPMFRFSSKSFDALVTPNHRMVVSQIWRDKHPMRGTGYGRPMKYQDGWGFVEAQELASSLVMPWASGMADATEDIETIQGFDADNLLRYLGWWISEGSVISTGLSICQAVGPLQRYMEDTLRRMGLFYKATVTNYNPQEQPMWSARLYKRMHPTLTDWVVAECGAGAENKHLPQMVWGLSLRQKQVLLDALVDGDGHRPLARPDTASYVSTSRQLADEIQRLAIEIGYPAIVAWQPGALPHHLNRYTVYIGRPQRQRISLRMNRHRSIVEYTGKVYCLTVPTGAYVTRRNGKMCIAGNSSHWYNKPDNCLCIWRDALKDSPLVEVHVQKVRNRAVGYVGKVDLRFDGRGFHDVGDMTTPDQRERYA